MLAAQPAPLPPWRPPRAQRARPSASRPAAAAGAPPHPPARRLAGGAGIGSARRAAHTPPGSWSSGCPPAPRAGRESRALWAQRRGGGEGVLLLRACLRNASDQNSLHTNLMASRWSPNRARSLVSLRPAAQDAQDVSGVESWGEFALSIQIFYRSTSWNPI